MFQPFNDDKERAKLLDLLMRSEILRASLPSTPPNVGPLVILHHPNLRDDPRAGATPSPEEIEQARRERRQILHVRVERALEGWLEMRIQQEESPHIIWSKPDDGPLIYERVIRLDDLQERLEFAHARYGAGCRVIYAEEDFEL
ncbi:MAG: hypothetical protein WCC37_05785 [Candidatus Sulfotelmatobacter sp.]|jgi:hypothetical protein